jgi:hypothetical protein
MEKPSWDSPHLTFEIERHGSLVNGGSRAEVQRWALDLDTMTAHCAKVGHRQIRPMQPKLDVRPFANEIVELILARREDGRLKWKDDRIVQVLIGKIIPKSSGYRRTVEDRRESFRTALGKLLERHGWRTDGPSVYKKVS